jgi:tetratricopeptide (TPR) repeat protein
MYQYRIETYYRNDIIFKVEDVFKEEELSLEIPRFVGNVTEKSYKNTVDLLSYCVQFAVNGSVRCWLVDSGNILHFDLLEPDSDKAVVQHYLKGRSLVKKEGHQNEAIDDLTKAIEMHDRHAQAYERRAKTNFILRNYHDANRDYTKAIGIDPSIPSAYFGRARVALINEDWKKAAEDLDQTIKKSIALEPIHWKARRLKGMCHLYLKEFRKAVFELKLYTHRKFPEGDPNIFWKRLGFFNYGKALLELEEYQEALAAFNQAYEMDDADDGVETSEILRYRGLTKQRSGKNGYIKDIKEAAKLGNKQATKLLAEIT